MRQAFNHSHLGICAELSNFPEIVAEEEAVLPPALSTGFASLPPCLRLTEKHEKQTAAAKVDTRHADVAHMRSGDHFSSTRKTGSG